MKRSFLSLVLVTPVVMAFGQRHVGESFPLQSPFSGDRGTDTAWAIGGELTVYNVTDGGFVVGNNSYGDKAKAQAFDVSGGEAVIDELLFFFGGKVLTSGNGASKVTAKVWSMDGADGVSSAGEGQTCPGSELASADILATDVDTTGEFTPAPLGPVSVSGLFAIGFDVTGLAAGDSVGLASTEFDDTSVSEGSWELWSDDIWHTMLSAWGSGAIDIAVAMVFTPVVGIEEEAALNGMKMTLLNGNLVNDRLELALSFANAVDARLLVNDASGREVGRVQLGKRSAGVHNTTLDMSGFGAGQYYVTLVSNGVGLSKKVVKN